MTFHDIITQLEEFAQAEWQKVEDEAIAIEQAVVPVVETALAQAAQQFGQLAVQTVMKLMQGAEASLSGGEKLNLTVTTLIDDAEKQALTLAHDDATALAKNAYVAVMSTAKTS